MNYTYKREKFFSHRKSNMQMGGGLGILIIGILLFIQPIYIMGIAVSLLGLYLLISGLKSAYQSKKRALNIRKEMIGNGYLSYGEVIDAGTKINSITERSRRPYAHRRSRGNRNYDYFHHFSVNHWIEIRYVDEQTGGYQRIKVDNMNKGGKIRGIIGKPVEVYSYNGDIYVKLV